MYGGRKYPVAGYKRIRSAGEIERIIKQRRRNLINIFVIKIIIFYYRAFLTLLRLRLLGLALENLNRLRDFLPPNIRP